MDKQVVIRRVWFGVSVFLGTAALIMWGLWPVSYWKYIVISGCTPNLHSFVMISIDGSLTFTRAVDGLWQLRVENATDSSLEEHGLSFTSPAFIFEAGQYPCLRMPHWAFAFALIALALAPWTSRRFSLRTMLIATTLVAVVLGLGVWSAR